MSNLEMFTRALKYCKEGTPGLLMGFRALYDSCVDDAPDQIIFTLVEKFTLTVKYNAIYDYRTRHWSDVRINIGLSEDDFFQLSLVQSIHLSYEEYVVLSEISEFLRNKHVESGVSNDTW